MRNKYPDKEQRKPKLVIEVNDCQGIANLLSAPMMSNFNSFSLLARHCQRGGQEYIKFIREKADIMTNFADNSRLIEEYADLVKIDHKRTREQIKKRARELYKYSELLKENLLNKNYD